MLVGVFEVKKKPSSKMAFLMVFGLVGGECDGII
jgi:hypothetical protein